MVGRRTTNQSLIARLDSANLDVASVGLIIDGHFGNLRLDVPQPVRLTRRIGDQYLEWQFGSPCRKSPLASGCLSSFLRLDGTSDDQILAFASRWGPLGLCAHR